MLASEILDWALWRAPPAGYHLQNLLWHAGVVLLLFAAPAAAGAGSRPLALAAAAACSPCTRWWSSRSRRSTTARICWRRSSCCWPCAVGRTPRARRRWPGGRGAPWLGVLAKENAAGHAAAVSLAGGLRARRRRGGPALRARAAASLAAGCRGGRWRCIWRWWVFGAAAVVSLTAEIPALHRDPLFAAAAGGARRSCRGSGSSSAAGGWRPSTPTAGRRARSIALGWVAAWLRRGGDASRCALRARRAGGGAGLALRGGRVPAALRPGPADQPARRSLLLPAALGPWRSRGRALRLAALQRFAQPSRPVTPAAPAALRARPRPARGAGARRCGRPAGADLARRPRAVFSRRRGGRSRARSARWLGLAAARLRAGADAGARSRRRRRRWPWARRPRARDAWPGPAGPGRRARGRQRSRARRRAGGSAHRAQGCTTSGSPRRGRGAALRRQPGPRRRWPRASIRPCAARAPRRLAATSRGCAVLEDFLAREPESVAAWRRLRSSRPRRSTEAERADRAAPRASTTS